MTKASSTEQPVAPPMRMGDDPDGGFPNDQAALEVLLAAIAKEEALWTAYIKELSAKEDPSRGVFFAAELHEARQYRMVLRYRHDFCQARLRRLA